MLNAGAGKLKQRAGIKELFLLERIRKKVSH